MPIHHSQKIEKETANELQISLQLVINHELKMQLLSYGAHVKVLKPKSLVDEFKTIAEAMLQQYE
jgi:predicted DNA-binding transcriptional regulator YafY